MDDKDRNMVPLERHIDKQFELFEKSVDERFKSLNEYINERFQSAQLAVDKATEVLKEKLEGLNEWRQQSKDQTATHPTRIEIKNIEKDIMDLRESRAELRGKANQKDVNISIVIAIVGFIIGIISILIDFIKQA
jgi:subtilase family serine protease